MQKDQGQAHGSYNKVYPADLKWRAYFKVLFVMRCSSLTHPQHTPPHAPEGTYLQYVHVVNGILRILKRASYFRETKYAYLETFFLLRLMCFLVSQLSVKVTPLPLC